MNLEWEYDEALDAFWGEASDGSATVFLKHIDPREEEGPDGCQWYWHLLCDGGPEEWDEDGWDKTKEMAMSSVRALLRRYRRISRR